MSLQSQMLHELEMKIKKKESEVHETKSGKKVGYLKEDMLLADCFSWLRIYSPQFCRFFFHPENEGDTAGEAGLLKGAIGLSKGKLAGVPDVICVLNGKVKCAEFKLPGKRLSKSQETLFPLWRSTGVEIVMVYSLEGWKEFVIHAIG